MSDRTYTAKLKGWDVKFTSRDLAAFRDMHIRNPDLAARMSELILFDIYILDAEFGVSPQDILTSIEYVEQGEPPSGIKPATQFKNLPLKGLWHKHYFSAQFLVQNIALGLGKNGTSKLVEEILDPSKSATITREMIAELAHRVIHDPLNSRDTNKNLPESGSFI